MNQDQLKTQIRYRVAHHPHIALELKQEILRGLRTYSEETLKELLSLIEEFDAKFIAAYDKAITKLKNQQPVISNQ